MAARAKTPRVPAASRNGHRPDAPPWELLEFHVVAVLVQRDEHGEISRKIATDPAQIGGVRRLSAYADAFPAYLDDFNAAQRQARADTGADG